MGLRLKERLARWKFGDDVKAAQEWAKAQEAEAAKELTMAEEKQVGDVDKARVIARGLGAAILGGVTTAFGDWFQNGLEFSRAGVYRALGAALAGGLGAGALYIRGLLRPAPTKPEEAPKA